MNKLFKYTAVAAAVFAASSAYADNASTKGGLTIKSDDGRFEATIGGRIHFDGELLNADSKQGTGVNENSGFYFRRVFITLKGKAYGWMYNIDEDISNVSSKAPAQTNQVGPGAGFNDVWLAKQFGDNTVYIGQHKPWRSLDEIASNNDTVFMERNALSANGLFGGRDFTDGVYYKYSADGLWLGASGYSQTKVGKGNTEGAGGNVRAAYGFPIAGEGSILHVGATYSFDQFDLGSASGNNGFGAPSAGYSTAYGKSGASFNVVAIPTSGAIAVTDAQVGTATAEVMGIFGPVFLQGEYGTSKFKAKAPAANVGSAKVDAYSVTAGWVVFGGSRTYKAADASYGAVKVQGVDGALEVAARYDNVKCKDNDAKVSAVTLGANYYVNPNVRFMVDYAFAKADTISTATATFNQVTGNVKPKALMARAQIAF